MNDWATRDLEEVRFEMDNRRIRSDSEGDGAFAARRGDKIHQGVDFEFDVGEDVACPATGRVSRIGYCYDDDLSYRYVEILTHNKKAIVRLLYVLPMVRRGDFVNRGDIIGQAQNIRKRYSRSMKNHVHCEVRIDPTILKGGDDETIPDLGGGDSDGGGLPV